MVLWIYLNFGFVVTLVFYYLNWLVKFRVFYCNFGYFGYFGEFCEFLGFVDLSFLIACVFDFGVLDLWLRFRVILDFLMHAFWGWYKREFWVLWGLLFVVSCFVGLSVLWVLGVRFVWFRCLVCFDCLHLDRFLDCLNLGFALDLLRCVYKLVLFVFWFRLWV